MEKRKLYFGYEEEKIREIFRNSKDQVDSNSKIRNASTLSQLAEASGRLLEEDKAFLREIYRESDE